MARIEQDIIYAIECLVYNYTGEAKDEISALIRQISATEALDSGYSETLQTMLGKVFDELLSDNQSRSARSGLITLRRRVVNTELNLLGKEKIYNGADPLPAMDEQKINL